MVSCAKAGITFREIIRVRTSRLASQTRGARLGVAHSDEACSEGKRPGCNRGCFYQINDH